MTRIRFIALACGASLSFAGVPSTAFAQGVAATPPIVVTGKWKRQWDKGSAMERKALGSKAEAQKALTKANGDIVDAQNRRDTNVARGGNASAEFRQLTTGVPDFADGASAAKWAESVNKAAERWKNADKNGGESAKDLDKAMKDQARAQKEVDKAQASIERGRAMKAEAERASVADGVLQ